MSEVIYHLPPTLRGPTVDAMALAETIDWGLKNRNIPIAWKNSKGKGIKVAVLDTGVPDHKDLPDPIAKATFVGGSDSDRNGHSSHCGGIIGARANGVGVVGVAPECDLMYGKVLGDNGSGSSLGIARGIDWAVENGADIISMSIGGGYDREVEAACRRAIAAKVLLIAAAGNSGANAGVDYPGRLPETIAVAAYAINDGIASFSSGGPEVDIAAPGQNILSTVPGQQYQTMSGTSMATPFIAGLCALILSSRPHDEWIRDVREMRKLLAGNAEDRGSLGKDNRWGYGVPIVTDLVIDTTYFAF